MTVINIPKSLDDHRQVEELLSQVSAVPADEKLIIDARHTRWASPYGLTVLLTIAQTRESRPGFYPPEDEAAGSYWARANFFKYAEELYEFHARPHKARAAADRSVLLECTPINANDDVHTAIGNIQDSLPQILTKELCLDASAAGRFAMTLAEGCGNIVEHAGRGGWVAVQTYSWLKRLGGRKVVVLAVCDAGMGIRRSLESSPHRRLTDSWGDGPALESAVLNGMSRHRDPGRGQGFPSILSFLERWDGKLAVRSGTARLVARRPEWNPYTLEEDPPLRENLVDFPGTHLHIIIPARVT